MILLQNSSFASYGLDDTLQADDETVRQFAGKSALTWIEWLDIRFSGRKLQWIDKPADDCRTLTDCFTLP